MKFRTARAWTIACDGYPCPFYTRATRRDAIEAFNKNVIGDKTIKDFPLYKPVKVMITVVRK